MQNQMGAPVVVCPMFIALDGGKLLQAQIVCAVVPIGQCAWPTRQVKLPTYTSPIPWAGT